MSCASEPVKSGNPDTASAKNAVARLEPIELEVFFIVRRAIVLLLVPESLL